MKFLQLKLPAAAFQADGPAIGFEITPGDIIAESAKPDKTDKASKPDEGGSEESPPKSEKKNGE